MYIYLIIDSGNATAKIGHAADLRKRLNGYASHNPRAHLAGYVKTYKSTGTALEHTARNELISKGGKRITSAILSTVTEWIDLAECPELLASLQADSLQALECCKGRKVYR